MRVLESACDSAQDTSNNLLVPQKSGQHGMGSVMRDMRARHLGVISVKRENISWRRGT